MKMDAASNDGRTGNDVLEMLKKDLNRGKWFILTIVISSIFLGFWRALNAPKIFEANAVIAAKKAVGGGGMLSQLSGLGGMFSAQLGLGVTGNERLAFTLGTREVISRVIVEQNLMPMLYPKRWDASKQAWKVDGFPPPSLHKAVERVQKKVLRITINPKKETILVSVTLNDSAAVAPVVNALLRELNGSIKRRVRKDAEANKQYLEEQLMSTSDPQLREKLHSLIAGEIEKTMLIGSLAFEELEPAIPPYQKAGPKRLRIVAMTFMAGLVASTVLALIASRLTEFRATFKKRRQS